MRNQLKLHVRAHLKFFLRNRLVLGLFVAALALWSLGFVPFLMFDTTGERFERFRYLSSQMHSFVWFYGGVLALFAMWSHLRDRSTRLIFTRPAALETWIASMFASALLIVIVGHALTGTVYAVMPMIDPFSDKTGAVLASMRVTAKDWAYLGATAAYASLVATFSFFAATVVLRRRTL